MPASRSIVAGSVGLVVTTFSTPSRPALRAACGRPPAGSATAGRCGPAPGGV